jgi:hypothetical protein
VDLRGANGGATDGGDDSAFARATDNSEYRSAGAAQLESQAF